MKVFTCIAKSTNKSGVITEYTLRDSNGTDTVVSATYLKDAIAKHKCIVTNLRLTKDNRLISIKQKTELHRSRVFDDKAIDALLSRAKVIGHPITEMTTICSNPCYLISHSNDRHTLIVPSNVSRFDGEIGNCPFSYEMKNIRGSVKAIGGYGLRETKQMFKDCTLDVIDLSEFDTSNVVSMESMFWWCRANKIIFSNFNTHRVQNMETMFYRCSVPELDLSSFDTREVISMCSMFLECEAEKINLESFKISNSTTIDNIFCRCNAAVKLNDIRLLTEYKDRRR